MRYTRGLAIVAAAVALALSVAACGGAEETSGTGGSAGAIAGDIRVDGSSTVGPLAEAAAEFFQQENPDVRVTVGISGTGGGFEKFAAGETDISDASRLIKDEEKQAVAAAGIEYGEMQVANDGIAVVVSKENTWATSLTVEHLKKIWNEGSTVKNWNQVDPSFPDVPLELFGPGTDSGTFDYFTDAINGEEGVSRTDYLATEDDNVAVQGVEGSKGGMAYFGLSYYEQNMDRLNVVSIDAGDGPVTPSAETVQSGEYKPLSRPLFIYVKKSSLERPEVAAFVQFYLDNVDRIAKQALFVPMTADQSAASQTTFDQLLGG
ncbi:MAG TPA: PstS family phosphate ABC transporter substrate-binding protein [Thermoleophilia bacterium]|nr:PstS family phosphate ABC transporter substrate-binding protein [Thermoleophilia bacterium]